MRRAGLIGVSQMSSFYRGSDSGLPASCSGIRECRNSPPVGGKSGALCQMFLPSAGLSSGATPPAHDSEGVSDYLVVADWSEGRAAGETP